MDATAPRFECGRADAADAREKHEDGWLLAQHICLCRTRFDTVVLDTKRNRYFCLGERETRALSMLAANFPPSVDLSSLKPLLRADAVRLADALVNAQLLTRSPLTPAGATLNAKAPLEWVSACGSFDETITLSPKHVCASILALTWATHALRRRPLYSVRGDLERRRQRVLARSQVRSPERVSELTTAFRRLRPFLFSAKSRCLLHALTLRCFLTYFDVHATWVIGVRTRPWAAHSWVQHGPLLLDGRPEDVLEYTPIMAA